MVKVEQLHKEYMQKEEEVEKANIIRLRLEKEQLLMKHAKHDEELSRINRALAQGIAKTLNGLHSGERKKVQTNFPDFHTSFFTTGSGLQYLEVCTASDKNNNSGRPNALLRTGSVLLRKREPAETYREGGITLIEPQGGITVTEPQGGITPTKPPASNNTEETETELVINPPLANDDMPEDVDMPCAQPCKRKARELATTTDDESAGGFALEHDESEGGSALKHDESEGGSAFEQPLRRSGRLKASSSATGTASSRRPRTRSSITSRSSSSRKRGH